MKYLLIKCCLLIVGTTCFAQSKNGNDKNGNEMKNPSTEIIRYTIPAEKHEDFEKAYSEAGNYLKQSAYCMNYRVLHGDEEPNNYIVIITWTSKEEHLEGFRKSDEFQSFFRLVRPFYNNIQEMKHYVAGDIQWKR